MERQLKMQVAYKGKTSQLSLFNCPSVREKCFFGLTDFFPAAKETPLS